MEHTDPSWEERLARAVKQYEEGDLPLNSLAEILLVSVSEATSSRGDTYRLACDLASELERHHDLRTSPWNTPDDVGPEDERDLQNTLAEVRKLISH
ncbi:hypothetical protein [Streptomyces lavendofoliae]|uniref:Uncharacterized protein n=1 Tax=Streptomyces lavendofoliae TaxID=67314 RepID=A0A918M517_9ACTN|nr:hypothetical protein [Streptomyces lavendofoliae]GGU42576.1 hypothetical protein GCM10010274_33250 [Streptomyces lavendofoliae]